MVGKLRVLTPRESTLQSIGEMILDFRKWLIPETSLLSRWKTQAKAYAVADSRMINDIDKQLASLRKKEVSIPVLVVAMEQITATPELNHVIGVPQEQKVVLVNDPEKRRVILRTEPRKYHIQFAFLTNDVHSANAFANQFASYIRLMDKRRFKVNYEVSPSIYEPCEMTIFENTIYPDNATIEESNIVIGLLEFDIAGIVPRVIKGLPQLYPDDFGDGSGVGGDANNPDHPNYVDDNPLNGWRVVVEADLFKDRKEAKFTRVSADAETGEIEVEQVDND